MFLPLGGHLLFQNKETVPPFASDCRFLPTWGGREGSEGSPLPHPLSSIFPLLQKADSRALPTPTSRRGFWVPGRALGKGAAAGPAHLITNVAAHLHKPWPGILLAGPAEGDVIGTFED